MKTKENRKYWLFATVIVGLVGVASLSASSVAASSTAGSAPSAVALGATSLSPAEVEEVRSEARNEAALLQRPAVPADALPATFRPAELSPSGLDAKSTRLMGSHGQARFWLGLDRGGLICLVAVVDGKDWVAASGCFTVEEFKKGGANVRVAAGDSVFEAYAVPDSAGSSELADSLRAEAIGANLVLMDPHMPSADRQAAADRVAAADKASNFELRLLTQGHGEGQAQSDEE